jgi:2-keto-4-pentenoate hydratase/2-oxohepta-3-ene-1,7-dioic acid hydratase in catechol pathway
MRLLTFTLDGASRFGIELAEGILDVHAANSRLPVSLPAYLEAADRLRPLLEALAAAPPAQHVHPVSAVRYLPPIGAPQKIVCIGLNYRDHAAEVNLPLPTAVIAFAKYANSLIGHGAAIEIPRESKKVDYEAELAFVIGRRGRHIPAEHAYEHIAGYTILNDVSVRDYQMRTSQWMLGKVFDTHAPCGPVIVTSDEIPDPQTLTIRTSIDGQVLQDSNTAQLVFDVPRLVAELSSIMTLEPGDIVATGTPAGVGTSRTPKRWMRPGERVRIEIEKIGVLENPVVSAPNESG